MESGAYHSDPGLLVAEQVIIANLMALYWMIAMQLVRKVSSACYAVAAVFDMCSFCTTCFALIAHGDLAPTKLIQDKDHRSSVRSAFLLLRRLRPRTHALAFCFVAQLHPQTLPVALMSHCLVSGHMHHALQVTGTLKPKVIKVAKMSRKALASVMKDEEDENEESENEDDEKVEDENVEEVDGDGDGDGDGDDASKADSNTDQAVNGGVPAHHSDSTDHDNGPTAHATSVNVDCDGSSVPVASLQDDSHIDEDVAVTQAPITSGEEDGEGSPNEGEVSSRQEDEAPDLALPKHLLAHIERSGDIGFKLLMREVKKKLRSEAEARGLPWEVVEPLINEVRTIDGLERILASPESVLARVALKIGQAWRQSLVRKLKATMRVEAERRSLPWHVVERSIDAIGSITTLKALTNNPKSSRFWEPLEETLSLVAGVSHFDVGLWENQTPQYTVVVSQKCQGIKDSWTVLRSYADFRTLHSELLCMHGASIRETRACLPNNFRWPSSKRAEGEERRPMLDAYLKILVSSSELETSKPLRDFLGVTESESSRASEVDKPSCTVAQSCRTNRGRANGNGHAGSGSGGLGVGSDGDEGAQGGVDEGDAGEEGEGDDDGAGGEGDGERGGDDDGGESGGDGDGDGGGGEGSGE